MKFAVFVLLLVYASEGEALRCSACFSRESDELCMEEATMKECGEDETVCISVESHLSSSSIFYRSCSTRNAYEALRNACILKHRLPRLGVKCEAICRAGQCEGSIPPLVS